MNTNMILYTTLNDELNAEGLMQDVIVLNDYAEDGALGGDPVYYEKTYFLAQLCLERLIALLSPDGFHGNLWQVYLTLILVNHENAFTLRCERKDPPDDSLRTAALQDMEVFRQLFSIDFMEIASCLNYDAFSMIRDFRSEAVRPVHYSTSIRDEISGLQRDLAACDTTEAFFTRVCDFYKQFGVGSIGLHKAFRIETGEGDTFSGISPIRNIRHVSLDDLVGYEIAKEELLRNTTAFVEGHATNNCLLYGDAGTGKSTSIKAIANQFFDQGLRIIEVYRHQFRHIHDVISLVKNRNYKFILYMDDLSFEEFETEYKYLKAVIEGGLEKRPENVLIYATSNRRHLVKERFSDKSSLDDDDIRHSDTVQEKLSLAHRFGVAIYFGPPTKKDYEEIVRVLAKRRGIDMDEETLLAQATKWEISHGGRTGRSAEQLIDYLSGE